MIIIKNYLKKKNWELMNSTWLKKVLKNSELSKSFFLDIFVILDYYDLTGNSSAQKNI